MIRIASLRFLLSYSALAFCQETVVLMHGIARTAKSMRAIQKHLDEAGYHTVAINYPSTNSGLDDIAVDLYSNVLGEHFWKNNNKVHFVTHSMGGLVVRNYLEKHKNSIPPDKLGRVVMLAPPNRGSEVADVLHKLKLYRWFYGPAGQELTIMVQEKKQIITYYELGIIAGTKIWPYFIARHMFSGNNDGRVSVERTKLKNMRDHLVISATHSFMMNKPSVHKQILSFLQQGEFEQI